jgi:hypothetical protein
VDVSMYRVLPRKIVVLICVIALLSSCSIFAIKIYLFIYAFIAEQQVVSEQVQKVSQVSGENLREFKNLWGEIWHVKESSYRI